ncbi:MAG TPA: FAD-dependent oxidoreductase [Gemmatimonadales bacterium]|nr:FAD-dependent oxidoreductase [Gemmatimonadales bacterium]
MTRLVLLGGGHAHLFVLEGLARGLFGPVDATLVSPVRHQAYSGMVPGLIGGRYRTEELSFDLEATTARAGVTFVCSRARRILPAEREVELEDGRRIGYDLLSVATGSTVRGTDLPGVREHALVVKPIDRAEVIVPALEQAAAEHGSALRVVVVGGGAAGAEVALALRARLRTLSAAASARVALLESGSEVVPDRAPAARRKVRRALALNGIELKLGAQVHAVDGRGATLADGSTVPMHLLVWAAGAGPSDLLRASALETDARGFLLVDDRLRSLSDPRIFAAGDAATLAAYPATPKAGVYAVREGPVLRDNLAAACHGRDPSRSYSPQHRFLALFNTGDGRAILSYGPLALRARWAMRLKDRIDRRFMRRFQRLALPTSDSYIPISR